jgi:hypothetical protein
MPPFSALLFDVAGKALPDILADQRAIGSLAELYVRRATLEVAHECL